MRTQMHNVFYVALIAVFLLPAHVQAGGGHDHGHGHGHAHEEGDEGKEEPSRGPNGGRLFKEKEFSLELKIFEDGVPPQFRVFMYDDGRAINPSEAKVAVELKRFARAHEIFEFKAEGDYLTSSKIVEEPHSFDVSISAEWNGQKYSWQFSSHEGRTELSEQALKVAQISVEKVGPQDIADLVDVYGRLLPSEDRVAHMIPRFPGVIREIKKRLGDRVEKGEVLAVIESNQSLQPYEMRSQISGEVIARHATLGEYVRDDSEIFVVADLTEIWADFQVYRDEYQRIAKGQRIRVDIGSGTPLEATVVYVSPLTDEVTQSKLVRAVLPNPQGALRPGLFVTGTLASAATKVPLAVRREAIQTFRDWNVVYITDGHSFQAMPVELGRRDAHYVEILSGLESGDKYVSKNSFIIKADIEKAGASHDH